MSQTEKTKHCMISLYMESKKKYKIIQMNVYAKQKLTHRYRKHTCGYGKSEEGQIRGLGLTNTNYFM